MKKPLAGKEVLVGITGGIAAYKTAELIRGLREKGAGVTVVMTEAAARFVTPLSFSALTGR
ncbi:MAG: flavoprotein, partial [Nitrospirota bacterium]